VSHGAKDAKLQRGDIDKVILVGGQTRSPMVERTVEKILGRKRLPRSILTKLSRWVLRFQGGVLSGDVKDIVLLDVLP
jgi:molecular chaperone DnaK